MNSETLKPHLVRHEEPDEYLTRVRSELPYFPDEVLLDWFYRNGPTFEFLDYQRLRFAKETWSTERILDQVITSNEAGEAEWRKGVLGNLYAHESYTLWPYMRENGTWPAPPIVFSNDAGQLDDRGTPLSRFHLLEGYKRLGYLHVLQGFQPNCLNVNHLLWIASFRKTETSREA